MLKVATVCSGIGSPEQALKELNIPHEQVFACEIDKYARQTYLANFTPTYIFNDMTNGEINNHYADIIIGGIPCQSFSLAGKRLGELDPRGLLFYNFYDYVKIQQPKYFIIENVKGLLSDQGGKTFNTWLELLSQSVNTHYNMFPHPDSLCYNVHHTVLNSKNFGVPQNRERVFVIGIRNDLPNNFSFPVGFPLTKRLKDILEPFVDEKYYLSEKSLEALMEHKRRNDEAGTGFGLVFNNVNGVSNTIKIGGRGKDDLIQETTTDLQYINEPICVAMRGRNPENASDRTILSPTEQRLEPNSQGITNTITSVQKDNLILEVKQLNQQQNRTQNRIRRLTEKECMRLQGFPDDFVTPCSSTQRYKMAGNSITVNVIKAILQNLLKC